MKVELSIIHSIRLHFNRSEHPEQGVADDGELRAVGFAYRLLGLRLDSERIDGRAVVVDAEIEVGTGGKAGAAHVADDFFLLHFRADLDAFGEARKVHIGGGVTAVVTDFQVISRSSGLVCLGDYLAFPAGAA